MGPQDKPQNETVPENGWTAITAAAPIDLDGNKAICVSYRGKRIWQNGQRPGRLER